MKTWHWQELLFEEGYSFSVVPAIDAQNKYMAVLSISDKDNIVVLIKKTNTFLSDIISFAVSLKPQGYVRTI
jgi:hypothetical protein